MSRPTVAQDARARNWAPSMRRTVEAMRRYPLHVVKPARLNTGCAACGCPVQPNTPAGLAGLWTCTRNIAL